MSFNSKTFTPETSLEVFSKTTFSKSNKPCSYVLKKETSSSRITFITNVF